MITLDILKKNLSYDKSTGLFTWLISSNGRIKVGDIAGTLTKKGYIHIGLSGKIHKAHRLAWLYVYGEIPTNTIDHIDGNQLNNKIKNLRNVTHSQNLKNTKMYKHNTSGFCGVYWKEQNKKWLASINSEGSFKYLGLFDNLSDAVKARIEAEKIYGFHINHGR